MPKKTSTALIILGLAFCSTIAWSQSIPADTLKVEYFANANTTGAPDATLRITNPGTAPGNVCASIYVFDPLQELSECCSCMLTPDGLRTLSVNTDLTSGPLTGVLLTTGVVKIVSTIPIAGACPQLPTKSTPEPALRSWATHVQNAGGVTTGTTALDATLTETASQDATLSPTEYTRLERECTAIQLDGSGHGVCTCGTGD